MKFWGSAVIGGIILGLVAYAVFPTVPTRDEIIKEQVRDACHAWRMGPMQDTCG